MCCSLNIAVRWIGFIGMVLSALLTSILLNDKVIDDYANSRKVALALGLDWQHLHAKANSTHAADPNGLLISSILVFYSAAYLLTNTMLIYATITENRCCAIPWLSFEVLNVLSKIFAMIQHQLCDHSEFSVLYYIGSFSYVVLGILWWCIVYTSQNRWGENAVYAREDSLISPPNKACTALSLSTYHDDTVSKVHQGCFQFTIIDNDDTYYDDTDSTRTYVVSPYTPI